MGYTHYWRGSIGNDNTERAFAWRDICMKASVVVDEYKEIIGYYDWQKDELRSAKVSYNEGVIQFNGLAGESCETFFLTKNTNDSQFCKTNERPYDMPVMLVLIAASEHGLRISSDGEEGEWQPAIDKYNELFDSEHTFDSVFS